MTNKLYTQVVQQTYALNDLIARHTRLNNPKYELYKNKYTNLPPTVTLPNMLLTLENHEEEKARGYVTDHQGEEAAQQHDKHLSDLFTLIWTSAAWSKPEAEQASEILYSDKIYLLMEISDAAVADGKIRLHMYFNGDNNSEGGLKQSWDNWDIDYMTEGKISNGGAYVSYEPSMYKWAGTQEDPWKWDTGNPIDVVSSGAGKGNVYEAELDYSCYPGGLADTFGFGIDIVDSSWATIGYLPNVAEGECPKVTLTKQQ